MLSPSSNYWCAVLNLKLYVCLSNSNVEKSKYIFTKKILEIRFSRLWISQPRSTRFNVCITLTTCFNVSYRMAIEPWMWIRNKLFISVWQWHTVHIVLMFFWGDFIVNEWVCEQVCVSLRQCVNFGYTYNCWFKHRVLRGCLVKRHK